MKLTVMTSSDEKERATHAFGRDDDHPRALDRVRLAFVFIAELFERLCAFSIMMIAESTIAPMAIAMPPSDNDVRSQISSTTSG